MIHFLELEYRSWDSPDYLSSAFWFTFIPNDIVKILNIEIQILMIKWIKNLTHNFWTSKSVIYWKDYLHFSNIIKLVHSSYLFVNFLYFSTFNFIYSSSFLISYFCCHIEGRISIEWYFLFSFAIFITKLLLNSQIWLHDVFMSYRYSNFHIFIVIHDNEEKCYPG